MPRLHNVMGNGPASYQAKEPLRAPDTRSRGYYTIRQFGVRGDERALPHRGCSGSESQVRTLHDFGLAPAPPGTSTMRREDYLKQRELCRAGALAMDRGLARFAAQTLATGAEVHARGFTHSTRRCGSAPSVRQHFPYQNRPSVHMNSTVRTLFPAHIISPASL